MIRLRDINFRTIWNASGARNFFGEGFWFHHWLKPFGLNYEGSTFVAKTSTLFSRAGNMPLSGTSPREVIPSCIKVYPRKGLVLNAVGLSGPGFAALLSESEKSWKKREDPFVLSVMSVLPSPADRAFEARFLRDLLKNELSDFTSPVGLQINFSCPNAGVNLNDLGQEIWSILDIYSNLNIPLIPKVNILFDQKFLLDICKHPAVDAISASNTIPWDKIPEKDRLTMFGSLESPLKKFGGGGLSGSYLLPRVADWIRDFRKIGFKKPILGGGGVLSESDAQTLFDAGATGIELGSISILRPWRVKRIIKKFS